MISIRYAMREDRSGIDKITKEFSDHEYSHSPKYFDDAINSNNILIAIYQGKVVGYLSFHIIWGNTPFIELLRVTASFQKQRIGSNLLSEFEGKMKEMGYGAILSSSELVNNIGNKFHIKRGFKVIGELTMIYGKEKFFLKSL